jgi:hypothetical protein
VRAHTDPSTSNHLHAHAHAHTHTHMHTHTHTHAHAHTHTHTHTHTCTHRCCALLTRLCCRSGCRSSLPTSAAQRRHFTTFHYSSHTTSAHPHSSILSSSHTHARTHTHTHTLPLTHTHSLTRTHTPTLDRMFAFLPRKHPLRTAGPACFGVPGDRPGGAEKDRARGVLITRVRAREPSRGVVIPLWVQGDPLPLLTCASPVH